MLGRLLKHQVPDKLPIVIDPERSKGCLLATVDRDTDGRPYYFYDFNHFAAKTLGDNRPDTIQAFMDHLFEVVNRHAYSDFATQAYYDYVLMMMSIAPKGLSHVLLVNSGAEATENALKAAKLIRGEKAEYVVYFEKAFHGRTGQALSVTDKPKVYEGFFRFPWRKVPYPVLNEDSDRETAAVERESLRRLWSNFTAGSDSEFSKVLNAIDMFLRDRTIGQEPDLDSFVSSLRTQLSPEGLANAAKAAAVIIEGYQGEGGIRFASPRFYQRLRMLTYLYDVPLIIDEIQSGMFITGKAWAHDGYDLPVPPDIVLAAKKAQMGVVYFSDKYHVTELGKLNSTWGGSEGGMVRAVSYDEVMREENLVERINQLGAYTLDHLKTLQNKLQVEIDPRIVSGARGRGLVLALDFKSEADRNFVMERALRRGLILNAAGHYTLRILPRYDTPTYDIDEMLSILKEAIRDLGRGAVPQIRPSAPGPEVVLEAA
jgi:L-lysine 6-transaminase